MKRDLDLARKILKELEKSETICTHPEIEGADPTAVYHHLILLSEAELITVWNDEAFRDDDDSLTRADMEKFGEGYRLTWQGHEFLDAARVPAHWKAFKKVASTVGGLSFEVAKQFLGTLAKEAADKAWRGETPTP